jgi:ferredoxin-thioredoxin reductase catalytic chain
LITLEQVRRRAEDDAKSRGYSLNYDESFLVDLLQGLRANEVRLGYPSCPCRMASGNFELDRDIICPCDYRDPDVLEHGACYCALFISNETAKGRLPIAPVPERRPPEKTARAMDHKTGVAKCDVPKETAAPSAAGAKGRAATGDASGGDTGPGKKLWYCKQCGYVAFREEPPYICPVCKAKRELFAEIALEMRGDG